MIVSIDDRVFDSTRQGYLPQEVSARPDHLRSAAKIAEEIRNRLDPLVRQRIEMLNLRFRLEGSSTKGPTMMNPDNLDIEVQAILCIYPPEKFNVVRRFSLREVATDSDGGIINVADTFLSELWGSLVGQHEKMQDVANMLVDLIGKIPLRPK
jgi:hypothetical protein